MELNAFKDKMIAAAKQNFDLFGEARPMAILLTRTGEPLMMPLSIIPTKDMIVKIIKDACKCYPVVALILVSEAFAIRRANEEYNPYEKPGEADDKKEVLTITFETKLASRTYIWNIMRDKAKPYLVEVTPEKVLNVDGRFVNLLTDPINQN